MTGISAVAVLGYKNQERYDATGENNLLKELVFRHVFSVGLQCPPNDELSMIKVKDFIHYLKYDLGWNISGVSCDGYQSLMLLQSLKLDGFDVREVSMDIIKNKEDIGYTTFRNVLVEQRIKLLKLHELIREITNLEKNDATGKVDHPRQTVKVLSDGTKIKSVGKDISDSLGGAIYNAVLSVDMNELDFMDGVTIADSTFTLNTSLNAADQYFGISVDPITNAIKLRTDKEVNTEDELEQSIDKEIQASQAAIKRIRESNKKTTLTNSQLADLYNDMTNDGFVIF